MRTVPKKKIVVLTASGYFVLTLLLDWLGVKKNAPFPTTWFQALFEIVAALVETAIFTTLFSLTWIYVLERTRGRLKD